MFNVYMSPLTRIFTEVAAAAVLAAAVVAVAEGEGDPPLFPDDFPSRPIARIYTEGAAAAVSAAAEAVTGGGGDPPLFPDVFPLRPIARIFTEGAAAAVSAAAVLARAEGEGDCRVGVGALAAAAVG